MDDTGVFTNERGEDFVFHDKETDIEPALRNLVGKKLSDTETTDTVCPPRPRLNARFPCVSPPSVF